MFVQTIVIKSKVDTRSPNKVVSRAIGSLSLDANLIVPDLSGVAIAPSTLYAIDESQFFGESLLDFWQRLLQVEGAAMVVAGLNFDYRRQPFGHTLALGRAVLERGGPDLVQSLAARCTHGSGSSGGTTHDAVYGNAAGAAAGGGATVNGCGRPALYTQRLRAGNAAAEGRSKQQVSVQVGGDPSIV
jgi:thymidine kinase